MKKVYIIFLLLCVVAAAYATLFPAQAKWLLGTQASEPTLTSIHVAPPGSLALVIEPDAGIAPMLSLINNASSSVDLVMYELNDTEVEHALAAAAGKGVAVRVLLNEGYYGQDTGDYGAPQPFNQSAYEYLESQHVAVRWTPSYFALTHQKTLVADDKEALIMSLNFVPKYYATGRDFAVDDSDDADVAAIERAFAEDWAGEESAAPQGDDLVWSPGSKNVLLALIASATSTIDIYNEEMADTDLEAALEAAAQRGVVVRVDMTYDTAWKTAFTDLANAGVQVRTYASSSKIVYIHAKMILVDNKLAFVGSENFSEGSLESNRELGIIFSQPDLISSLSSVFNSDWANARPFVPTSF